ncbi:MAG TPA: alkaline phosphatase family protein [Stellaceae bacterium]|nr:alkaline phosphatase family protein [Stellaceae bacterium]
MAAEPHNVVLFVPDGLRAGSVTPEAAPAMDALRKAGVGFLNPHSMYPTFTTPNAASMATGHLPGDTGDFGNVIYTGFPVPGAGQSLTPFLESDPVLGDVDEHFSGNYLDETTLLKLAREAGLDTAAVGKLGPTLIFDHTERTGQGTVVLDDQTGSKNGIPLAGWVADAIAKAGLPPAPPARGENGKAGDAKTPGTHVANVEQQDWFAAVFTKVLLPKFKADGKPFVAVFWSRDPDGTQHNQGDSLGSLTPGINGPTSAAGIRNADNDLGRIRAALDELDLAATTDVIVSADHGFSTISKESKTSAAAEASYPDVPAGMLPPGFVALDLAAALNLPLFDPDQSGKKVEAGTHSRLSNGLIGDDPAKPQVVVAANGGSDLVYLPPPVAPGLAGKVVDALLAEDYVGGLFVDASLGRFPGTLPLDAIGLAGSAVTPMPAIAISFRSWSTGCKDTSLCQVEIADTALQQGQGMHGSFGRGDIANFMAAAGPDFKAGLADKAPAGNADIGRTAAAILGLKLPDHGHLVGRVLTEAMKGGAPVESTARNLKSAPTKRGLVTILFFETVGGTRYFDAAGIPGRTVGIEPGVGRLLR